MTNFRCLLFLFMVFSLICRLPAQAGIDTAVLTQTRQIQAYIYHSADLTLIKDTRTLYFTRGMNPVRFSWAGTRIDPTSLSLDISDPSLPLDVRQLQFPAHEKNQAIWHVNAEEPCRAEVVIHYFTSGIFWQPSYTAILSRDRTRMQWTGRVRVENRSGMDYADARVSLVTGNIHLLDRIADLANQPFPHGRPDARAEESTARDMMAQGKALLESAPAMKLQSIAAAPAPRPITKSRASDYVVYTLDGEKTLSDGWSDQVTFVQARSVPVDTLYVFDTTRFGDAVIRMVSFINDVESGLGTFPLPGGTVTVFQAVDSDGGKVFAGTDTLDYIPAGKRHHLRLGPDPRIKVTPRVMTYAKTHLTFDEQNNLSAFDEVKTMAIHLANFSDHTARIDIFRTIADSHFSISDISGHEAFEKIDQHRFKFSVTVSSGSGKTIEYTLTIPQGDRKWPSAS
jgi:hypothetical protein